MESPVEAMDNGGGLVHPVSATTDATVNVRKALALRSKDRRPIPAKRRLSTDSPSCNETGCWPDHPLFHRR
jgi:hypothetical protein